MRKTLIVLVILVIGASIYAKAPPEGEPGIVTVMTWDNDDANYSLLGEQPVIEYVEEKLNIEIEWQLFPHGERGTAINLMIAAGGDMPDLFPKYIDVAPRVLAEKDIIIPWSDLLDEGLMPLAKAKMDSPRFFGVKNQMIDDETGKIYALPYTNWNPLLIWTDYVRGDWLEKLGLDIPETVDEYRDMLRAIKTQDPNGNGKADEIPWQNFYAGTRWIKMWSRMFGLPTPDYSLSTVDTPYWACVDKEEIVFTATHPQFKAMLIYLNDLWKEGLINQEQFEMSSPKFNTTVSNNTLGTQNMWPSAIPGMTQQLYEIDSNAVWTAMPYAIDPRFMKPEDRVYAFLGPVGISWLLAKNGKNIGDAVRLMDFVFGDEDFVFTIEYGIEGVHHKIENGEPVYIGKWAEMDEKARHSALGSHVGRLAYEKRNIAVLAKVENSPVYEDFRAYKAEIAQWIKPATIWKLSEVQQDITRAAMQNVQTFIDESITKFIIGIKPFGEWDAYVATINKEAGDEIEAAREVYQTYFDNFVKAHY